MKAFALLAVLGCAACSSPAPHEVDSTPLLQGAWTYSASQGEPQQLRLEGILTITQQNGSEIAGSIDYTEYDRAGIARQRVELFTGRIREDGSVTIDAGVTDGVRRHTGVLVNDSIGGDFERPGNGNNVLYGSFGARRR